MIRSKLFIIQVRTWPVSGGRQFHGIGYCAESYVDFGPAGMFLPVFLLGVYYGFIYRAFVIHSTRKIFAFSIVASLMFSCAFALETTNSILLGRVAVYSLAMACFIACLGGRIWEFLAVSPNRKLCIRSFREGRAPRPS